MNVNNPYSFWRLFDKLYNAKRDYYTQGRSKLTDQAYDYLEESIKAIHGEESFQEWNCVGYDQNKHVTIRINLDLLRGGMT